MRASDSHTPGRQRPGGMSAAAGTIRAVPESMRLAPIDRIEAAAFRVPTDAPESDGTLEWDATTLVVAHVWAGGVAGLGITYASSAAAAVIRETLAPAVMGADVGALPRIAARLKAAVRNLGSAGVAATAIAAVDGAVWDLHARLLGTSVIRLLGKAHERVPVYGSGGFTSYSIPQLERQLAGWVARGIGAVKIKVGRDPDQDPRRIAAARRAIGPDVRLMIDANGALDRRQALRMAEVAAEHGVTWFEEPVVFDDLEGLRFLRARAPRTIEIAAGEYAYDLATVKRMIDTEAVDVVQVDATRCLGPSGFLKAAAVCEAAALPLSAHTAPALHATLCAAATSARDVEYFHDHARLESMLFDGVTEPRQGTLDVDPARPGFGLELRAVDAERYRV